MNDSNLKPFQSGPDPRRNLEGRPVGSKSRSTIVRKWLEVETEEVNPITGNTEKLTQEDYITLQQIKNAKGKGEEFAGPAYKNLMDSAYGAPKQEIDSTVTGQIVLQVTDKDSKLGE